MNVEYLPIESVNFGVVPTLVESANVIWVKSRFPPPDTLQVDESVLVVDCDDKVLGKFIVDDIIGTRIVLMPNDAKCFHTIKPSELCDLQIRSVSRKSHAKDVMRDWVYGSGTSAAKLAFIPK